MKSKFLFLLLLVFFGAKTILLAQTTLNIVPYTSAVSASYTASWNNLNAINNSTIGYGSAGGGTPVLDNTETWGSWSTSRPTSQWLDYDWANEYPINLVTVYFWADIATMNRASGNVAIPASWKIQYWNASFSAWVDVTLAAGQSYTCNIAPSNTVQFNGVTTSKLRMTMNAQSNQMRSYAAMGVTEWQVFSTLTDPTIMVNTTKVILSDVRGKKTLRLM